MIQSEFCFLISLSLSQGSADSGDSSVVVLPCRVLAMMELEQNLKGISAKRNVIAIEAWCTIIADIVKTTLHLSIVFGFYLR